MRTTRVSELAAALKLAYEWLDYERSLCVGHACEIPEELQTAWEEARKALRYEKR